MSPHSPGPWSVVRNGTPANHCMGIHDDATVDFCYTRKPPRKETVTIYKYPNGKLIAHVSSTGWGNAVIEHVGDMDQPDEVIKTMAAAYEESDAESIQEFVAKNTIHEFK